MSQLIPLLLISIATVLVLMFLMRMFRDMLNNEFLPPGARNYWTLAEFARELTRERTQRFLSVVRGVLRS